MILKMGPRSPKSNQFFFMSHQYSVQVWLKSIHSFMSRQAIFQQIFLSTCVTLKMGSRSPKFKQFFSMSQQYRCTSLVKIHTFILQIGCRQAFFQQSEPSCDLENGPRSPKSDQFFSMSEQYRCKVKSKSTYSFWR